MENPPDAAPAAALPPQAGRPPAAPYRPHVARWMKELATVFVGVYAAFALNAYQIHRQERQRREQILVWALREYGDTLTFVTHETEYLRGGVEIFRRRVAAGETPALHAFNFRSDYEATDFTSMLQSGGFDLLEVDTVRDIRAVEGSLRQMIEVIRHDQQLSDALILPNLDKQPDAFYDPATKQLRPTYAWYSEYFTIQLDILGQMQNDLHALLAQLRVERERNR